MQRKNNHTSDRGTRPKLKISTNCPNLSNLSAFKTQCHKLLQSKHCITRRIWRKKKNGIRQKWCGPANNITVKYLQVEGQQPDPSHMTGFGS